jgi:nucleotide-binding universal stress UspA family protein
MVMSEHALPMTFVVPVDRNSQSDEAMAYATAIARPGDEILLLHAVPLSDINPVVIPRSVSLHDLRHQVLADAEHELRESATKFEAPEGVTVRTLALDGIPAEAIVEHAPSLDQSMIIMASHGRGIIGRLTYGSVADRVARTSHAPVLLVRFDQEREQYVPATIKRLVVPLDGSSRSQKAVPHAVKLARRLGTSIVLVSVAEIERLSAIYGAALSAAAYAELADEAETDVLTMLEGVAERIRNEGIQVEIRVMAGAVTAGIEAVTEPGDVIVMTSHGRGGVRRWIIGSVAEQLGRTSEVPVMLVPAM